MDLVTGKVFFSATHKKVTGPFRVVHSKNRAVYTFYNEKARRTEVASMEMYEGKEQSNATTFCSIDSQLVTLVERQAYILPLDIAAMHGGLWLTIEIRGSAPTHNFILPNSNSSFRHFFHRCNCIVRFN